MSLGTSFFFSTGSSGFSAPPPPSMFPSMPPIAPIPSPFSALSSIPCEMAGEFAGYRSSMGGRRRGLEGVAGGRTGWWGRRTTAIARSRARSARRGRRLASEDDDNWRGNLLSLMDAFTGLPLIAKRTLTLPGFSQSFGCVLVGYGPLSTASALHPP